MAVIFTIPRAFPQVGDLLLASGKIGSRAVPGGKLEFYLANTTSPVDTFIDAARTTKHTWPVIADATGKFPMIILPGGIDMDVIWKDASGETIDTYEDVDGGPDADGSDATDIGRSLEVGTIVWHSLQEVPAGWLRIKRDPQALIKSEFAELNAKYAAQGYPYGSTATTFNIPGGAGLFPRIWDNASTYDPESASRKDHATGTTNVGNLIGSRQVSQNQSHTHTASTNSTGDHAHSYTRPNYAAALSGGGTVGSTSGTSIDTSTAGAHSHTVTINNDGGVESRPNNVAFPMIIFVSPAQAAAKHTTIGMAYQFSTATADADPGLGYLRLNNAVPAAANFMYLSKTDAFGANVGTYIEGINLSTGPIKALMTVHNVAALGNSLHIHVMSDLIDGGAYWKVPIQVRSSLGALLDEARLAVSFGLNGGTSTVISLPPIVTTYTSSQTWVKSFGRTRAHVRGCAGGGGGGNVTDGADFSAGGGGSGGEFDFWLDISSITSVAVTIGAGGAAGASGGATSFGTHATANGGQGAGSSSGTNMGPPGLGGTTTGLGGKSGAQGGRAGVIGSSISVYSGAGAGSRYGGGGQSVQNTGPGGGASASGFGAGGSGATQDNATFGAAIGGVGSPGLVIIEEFA